MEEKPNSNSTGIATERGSARRRLLTIAILLFPIAWALYGYCVDTWIEPITNGEKLKRGAECMGLLALDAAVVYCASLVPPFRWVGRFLDWLGSGRIARRALKVAIWVVTAIALFYAEEDWRGNRAWNSYRAKLEANGAQFDLASYVPKPVPDQENFAATPVVKSWFVEVDKTIFNNTTERYTNAWDDNYAKLTVMFPASLQDMKSRHFMDLAECAKIFEAIRNGQIVSKEYAMTNLDHASRAAAVPAVLAGLKTNETALAELQAASGRPLSRYPVFYDLENPWGTFLPHLKNVQDACQRLQLRACAELVSGRSDDALKDVKLMLYLSDSVKDEPFLISCALRAACVRMATQPVWEGLAEHAWTDKQLQELEERLQHYNFIADTTKPLDCERGMGIFLADVIKKRGWGFWVELMGPGQPTQTDKRIADWLGSFVPGGWYQWEKLNCALFYERQLDGALDGDRKRLWPQRVDSNALEELKRLDNGGVERALFLGSHHQMIASCVGPALTKVLKRAAEVQTVGDQAALACALERYRLANGSLPETLDALAPKFISQLPNDVITGTPMKYRRTDDGQFVLYSVGWNEKDDGGTPGKNLFDDKNGDWVWSYPVK